MKLTDITPAIALTPLDGRYHKQTAPLVEYLSEPALNRERMRVEVEWMILLANGFDGNGNQPIVEGVKPFTEAENDFLRAIPENFGAEGIKQHAAHEAVTHHDVKAVETISTTTSTKPRPSSPDQRRVSRPWCISPAPPKTSTIFPPPVA